MKTWQDTLNLLQRLTFRKTWNIAKTLSSYYVSRFLRKPIHWGLPYSISIEPTTACNLRCPECPSGLRAFTRSTGVLDKTFYEKIIDELSEYVLYLTLYFQGEPYLHPHFFDLVQYASQKKIYTATSTNAHFLHEKNAQKTLDSGLDKLIISIDGTTQETYEQYRIGGNLKKVIQGTENLLNLRKKGNYRKPYTIFQFLVVKPNEHQIKDIKQLAKNLGVDKVVFKTAQIYDYENGSPLMPTQSKYSRYALQANGKYAIKNPLLNQCWRMWQGCVITWDGKVVPCCFDKDATHQLGSLKERTLQEIWQSEAYQSFRQKLLIARKEIDICRNCTEGTKVWV
ncbi:MAG: radical SAM/SPASM domain-containing protein [Raineya sp.]|nr:SPASM domain-containing protein [Raineya sp.]MDW8295963.1 radical SAM/SPASM domain-containing protein [Raineya sp.]